MTSTTLNQRDHLIQEDVMEGLAGAPQVKDAQVGVTEAIQHVLDWSTDVPKCAVQAEVRARAVVLTGEVEWNYQRKAAKRLARGVIGVLDVDNRVVLTARVSGQETTQLIKDALTRRSGRTHQVQAQHEQRRTVQVDQV